MTFVGLLILTGIGEGTFVDFTLLGAYKEREVVELVEVEAQTTS